jgi:4'-phosphopantetheinyl transferase
VRPAAGEADQGRQVLLRALLPPRAPHALEGPRQAGEQRAGVPGQQVRVALDLDAEHVGHALGAGAEHRHDPVHVDQQDGARRPYRRAGRISGDPDVHRHMIWSGAGLRALADLPLGSSEVVHAFVSLAGVPTVADRSLLDPQERARAQRFVRAADADRYVLAHAALRTVLARCLGADPATVRYAAGEHGKPALVPGGGELEFSLSHAGDVALVAATRAGPVGVDVERLRAFPDALAIADAHFSAAERRALRSVPADRRAEAFLRAWTRKEAVVKAAGGGLAEVLDAGADVAGDAAAAGWEIRELAAPPGYVAAGAVPERASGPVPWRRLTPGDPGAPPSG